MEETERADMSAQKCGPPKAWGAWTSCMRMAILGCGVPGNQTLSPAFPETQVEESFSLCFPLPSHLSFCKMTSFIGILSPARSFSLAPGRGRQAERCCRSGRAQCHCAQLGHPELNLHSLLRKLLTRLPTREDY